MDIISPKNSKLLYQRGDKKTEGVIDLSCFSVDDKRITAKISRKQRVVQDIKNIRKTYSKDKTDYRKKVAGKTQEAFNVFFEDIIKKNLTRQPTINFKFNKLNLSFQKSSVNFAIISIVIPIFIFSLSFLQSQFEEKGHVLGMSTTAYENFKTAAQYASESNFDMSKENLNQAGLNFVEAQKTIDNLGMGIGKVISEIPIETPISTAQNLTKTGENLSMAGQNMTEILKKISEREDKTLFESLIDIETELVEIENNIRISNENIQKIDLKYIPEEVRPKIALAQETLPILSENFTKISEDYPLIKKLLGAEKQQRYLLIFQNNSEVRATGGFIGSYGIVDIENGEIKNLFIDDIFNPDGQLKEKIVPPMPIQKISAAWSMHDANWFADFPTSAKKIALFYEKTGGTTVDGVVSITPELIKNLLEITGPIEMTEYNTTITSENFLTQTQNQVENLYEKEENEPKKIISDLAPILLEKLFKQEDYSQEERINRSIKVIKAIEDSLREKHILIYHREEQIEDMIEKRGWAGEIIQNEGDYISVVNSNINGYKTDAVIEETISLNTEILLDGSIINTVEINRKHTGGNSEYDWYNRVNADYMRVYVPKGSILLEAKGNTVEEYIPPMDYNSFKTDAEVQKIENSIKIDPDSQTQIFEESGKTVFGNWVYVSPQEEVTMTYKYKLPFNINFENFSSPTDTYKILVQKQSGTKGSYFKSNMSFPQGWNIAWKTNSLNEDNQIELSLNLDLNYGIVFQR